MVLFKDYFSSFVSSERVHLFGNLYQGEQVDGGRGWRKTRGVEPSGAREAC